MNLFVTIVTYTKPFSEVQKTLQRHREFLKTGYESGNLLVSGPQNPKTGGIVIGKFESKEQAQNFFKNDPYAQENLAIYDFIEFDPVLHQEAIKDFLKDKNP